MPRKKRHDHPIHLTDNSDGVLRTLVLSVSVPVSSYPLSNELSRAKKIPPLEARLTEAVQRVLTDYERAGLDYITSLEKKAKTTSKPTPPSNE